LNTQPHIDLGLEHDPRLPDSSIAVPLSVRGRVIGGFEVQSTQPDAYHTEHITAMRMAATLAAISMENVQLLDHLQRSNVELEHRVTERTAELNKTNLELEYANRAKDEFLANMSHELRTPLNSILGLSESMLEQYRDTLSENQQRSLQTIESSGKHLLDLINDVLDLAKIEAGKLDHYPQSINVDDLCKSSLIFVKTQTMKKNITLTYEIEDTIADFSADPRRLKQILVNLLTNAVKFTPNNGHVTLKVNVTQGVIQFSVIDTGIGIAPEDLRRLFTPFVQVESSLNRRFEGTGLGLALVHKLTDLHGGCIEVESEVGKGSRFTIKLPYQRNVSGQTNEAEISISHPVVEANFQPKIKSGNQKILLVEDNQANILTIGEYLENHGYEIVIANDGVQAIEKANEINPDIILMDIQMPLMDGIEATRRLRSDVRFASTPIIALTALVMPGDRERCLESGANEYISKPVSPKELRKIIETFLNK
jgi:signal transduction histidine kinase